MRMQSFQVPMLQPSRGSLVWHTPDSLLVENSEDWQLGRGEARRSEGTWERLRTLESSRARQSSIWPLPASWLRTCSASFFRPLRVCESLNEYIQRCLDRLLCKNVAFLSVLGVCYRVKRQIRLRFSLQLRQAARMDLTRLQVKCGTFQSLGR